MEQKREPTIYGAVRLAMLLIGAGAFLIAASVGSAHAPQDQASVAGIDQHMSMTPMMTGTHGPHPSMTPQMTMTPMMTGTPNPGPPGGDDTTPPQASLAINSGAATTNNPVVTLQVEASDNAGGSGLAWMHIREWGWDHDHGWHEMHHQGRHGGMGHMGGWNEFRSSVEWELSSAAGMKYVTVWVADAAWNVSAPVQAMINFVPDSTDIGQGNVHQYRRHLRAGQTLDVEVRPHVGDPDVYGWEPGNVGEPNWWSHAPSGSDMISMTAPMDGLYLIEVHGYTNAAYGLHMRLNGQGAVRANTVANQEKELPAEPLVVSAPEPDEAPRPGFRDYLPLVTRR